MANPQHDSRNAVIVGAGPNGLTAAVVLARTGWRVEVFEANEQPGGGCRSAELTLPGFIHDSCSAVHPMGVLSPAFRALKLESFGLEWVRSVHPLAHPLPDGRAAVLARSFEETAATLGDDGAAWRALLAPFADEPFLDSLLGPLWFRNARSLPPQHAESAATRRGSNIVTTAGFGLLALRSGESIARARFQHDAARALFAGCAAHSVLPLDQAGTAAFGLVLAATAHAIDWPVARGGSQSITRSLVAALHAGGGTLHVGQCIRRLQELPDADAYLFDLSPRQVAEIAGDALPSSFATKYRHFQHGPGVFKLDWALREPIPWANPACRAATTVHVGGSFEDILRSERGLLQGAVAEQPFVLVAQPSLIDPSRAPAGRHTGWAYCHVPNGCTFDLTDRIETQIERFAPGFRDCILARHTFTPASVEANNHTMIGGDMAGGRNNLTNFLFRPVLRWNPYSTPNPKLFLCSSSTPPGGGVHGMCGYHAAEAVLRAQA